MARKATATAMPARRVSALDHIIAYGRQGADHPEGPGVKLSLRHPVSMVTVITRKGKSNSLSNALNRHYGFHAPQPGQSVFVAETANSRWGPGPWVQSGWGNEVSASTGSAVFEPIEARRTQAYLAGGVFLFLLLLSAVARRQR